MRGIDRAWSCLLAALAVAMTATDAVAAQQVTLSGVVRDATGVVPGASVVVVSAGREVARTSLNVDNLFDRSDYFLPGHFSNLVFPGPPITVTTAMRVKY